MSYGSERYVVFLFKENPLAHKNEFFADRPVLTNFKQEYDSGSSWILVKRK